MPKRRRSIRRSSRKRKFSRKRLRRSSKRRTVNVNRALQPFSQRYLCKLNYAGNFSISTLNVPYVFNLNSIYDPDSTGVGHQPYGRDTLATMYNRYRVYYVKWHIRAQPLDGANNYIVAVPSNDALVVTSIDDAREKPRSRYVIQNGSTGGPPIALKGKLSLPSLAGKTKAQYMADDRYQADMNNDPAESMKLYIYAYNAGALTTAPSTRLTIELTYYIECFDPIILGSS